MLGRFVIDRAMRNSFQAASLLLDRGGRVAVLDHPGPRHGVQDRLLQHRQVGVLLDQRLVVVEGLVGRGERGVLEERRRLPPSTEW